MRWSPRAARRKNPAAALPPRYQNEREMIMRRAVKKGRDGCFSAVSSGVIKYATGLSDVFIKLYSCPCLSKLLLLVCSFIRGSSLAPNTHFGSSPFNNNAQCARCGSANCWKCVPERAKREMRWGWFRAAAEKKWCFDACYWCEQSKFAAGGKRELQIGVRPFARREWNLFWQFTPVSLSLYG